MTKLPPLRHSNDGAYDVRKSKVARWLVSQPELMQALFDLANESGAIRYDKTTGLWQGNVEHLRLPHRRAKRRAQR